MSKLIMPTPKTMMESDVTPTAILDYTEAQTFLRLDGTQDQTLVESLIGAVTEKIESHISKKLITQVWSVYFDFFPRKYNSDEWWDGERDGAVASLYSSVNFLDLPFGPCQTVSFVRAYDESDGTTTVDASTYSVDTVGDYPKIRLKSGGVWPAITLRPVNGVHVKATFGYGAKTDVPKAVIEAAKIMLANVYEHRGDVKAPSSIPPAALALLDHFRKSRI